MKYLLTLLFLIGSVFAQKTTYRDGTECECDSLYNMIDSSTYKITQFPYKNGNINGIVKTFNIPTTLKQIINKEQEKCSNVFDNANVMYYKSNAMRSHDVYIGSYRVDVEMDSIINLYIHCIDSTGESYRYGYSHSNIPEFYNTLNVINTISYLNGHANGLEIGYGNNNVVLYEIPWVNGKKHGNAKWYNMTGNYGQISGTATFKDDKLVGYKKCADGRFGNEFMECNDRSR